MQRKKKKRKKLFLKILTIATNRKSDGRKDRGRGEYGDRGVDEPEGNVRK